MTKPTKTPRTLTREERRLWEKIARDVKDKDRVSAPQKMTSDMLDEIALKKPGSPHGVVTAYAPRQLPSHLRTSTAAQSVRAQSAKPSKLHAGDPRMDRHVRRGRREIEATIDLHGLTQIVAHERLKAFVKRARIDGVHTILVITGKGGNPVDRFNRTLAQAVSPIELDRPAERGVLRSRFIDWVNQSPLREQITRVAPAKQTDGGAGAFYVFLKKLR